MDVADGLLGDLGKLCAASEVGATVELDALPVSTALRAAHGLDECERFVLSGGDDYELLFTLPAAAAARYEVELRETIAITRIGEIVTGRGVRCERAGLAVDVAGAGYDHFA
jgi:thiamine-monophosphate kinase